MPYQPNLCCLASSAFLGSNNEAVSEHKPAVVNLAVARSCAACSKKLHGHIVQGAALIFCNADFDIQGKPGSLEIYQLPWSLPDDCSDFSQHCLATKNPQEVHASCQR